MALRRTPFDEMERMMDQMRGSMFGDWAGAGGHAGTNLSLETDEDGYVVLLDLPGFEKEEIDLRFEDELLTIEAEHEVTEDAEREGGYARSARSRRVAEQVRVPGEVLVEEITASYRNGVLEIHLPTVEDVADDSTAIDIE